MLLAGFVGYFHYYLDWCTWYS